MAAPALKDMNGPLPFHSALKTMELANQARALRSIADGSAVAPTLYKRLDAAGLITKTPAGWNLTQQGHIALAFSCAR